MVDAIAGEAVNATASNEESASRVRFFIVGARQALAD
jgi:hypothetical protein